MVVIVVFFSIIIILWLVNLYRWSTVKYLNIEAGVLYVTYSRLLRRRLKKSYPLSEIDFIYRDRPIADRWFDVGLNSRMARRGNVLTVFWKQTALFDLEPGNYGWKDYGIRQVALDLKHSGVKQVVDKYGDKDVVLE
ncbi:hypothetical protein C8P68_102825 [Mucilaginibacter yixingensis]|uniref:Uncharacterized protein n=1 Tax=Mucilaginibacter yixingensis TaxID=1295612 RepID=A0A2T5JE12_9SPHI|nr:hypothetical protein [Mucilaginibacter yixingensis]PTQ99994.1 hypothetical protein C8P68_102825 [Mucilaginibacter yixingensis]